MKPRLCAVQNSQALLQRGAYERLRALRGSELNSSAPGRLHGSGIGWVDAHLLASALVGRLRLWTTDPALATAAKELGVAYE